MIRFAEKKHIKSLRMMWKLCFSDTEEFISFYFNSVFKENQTLLYLIDDEPVASLQMIPYQIKIEDQIYNASYISGAMTHPNHRKNGYMRTLLYASFKEMGKIGMTFSFLIPQEQWLFGFYSDFGYINAFPIYSESVDLSDFNHATNLHVQEFSNPGKWQQELYPVYFSFLIQNNNAILKTEEQFNSFLTDLFIDGGKVFYLDNQGIAFALPFKNTILIKELFYKSELIKENLFNAIYNSLHKNRAKYLVRKNDLKARNAGMIKIIDKERYKGEMPQYIYMSMMLD